MYICIYTDKKRRDWKQGEKERKRERERETERDSEGERVRVFVCETERERERERDAIMCNFILQLFVSLREKKNRFKHFYFLKSKR